MRRWLIAGMLLCGLSLGVLLAHAAHHQEQRVLEERRQWRARRAGWEELKGEIWGEVRRFKGESALFVEDLTTGWKAGYREGQLFPAASVVKMAILAAYLRAVDEGRIQPGQRLTLRRKDKVQGSGVLKELPDGTQQTAEELAGLMIARSDNTAANLLIDLLGLEYLNDSFRRMGLKETRLSRKMMDFSLRRKGVENVTTAEETALVWRRFYEREVGGGEAARGWMELLKGQEIRDRIPALLPPGTVVANKTGLERGVCHDSGILFGPRGDLLICVLTRNGSASRPAKRFIARVARHAWRYCAQ